jgi:putative ABC transport system permease protein
MLGVVIGVAAVIALVTIGRSATAHITDEVTRLGDNLVWAQPGSATGGSPLPHGAARRHRGGEPAGGRHRHHEHHAGERD